MKVNIFKKLIRDIIREELDYKFSVLEKKLDEVLVSNRSNVIVEDRESQPVSSPTKKVPVSAAKKDGRAAPSLTKDSVLNDILNETAEDGKWKNIDKEAEVKSVTENTQGLPGHLTEALTKDYSSVMKAVDEKAKFRSGT